MLTRTLAASVLPRSGRLRAALPNLRRFGLRLTDPRQRSLLMQDRADRSPRSLQRAPWLWSALHDRAGTRTDTRRSRR